MASTTGSNEFSLESVLREGKLGEATTEISKLYVNSKLGPLNDVELIWAYKMIGCSPNEDNSALLLRGETCEVGTVKTRANDKILGLRAIGGASLLETISSNYGDTTKVDPRTLVEELNGIGNESYRIFEDRDSTYVQRTFFHESDRYTEAVKPNKVRRLILERSFPEIGRMIASKLIDDVYDRLTANDKFKDVSKEEVELFLGERFVVEDGKVCCSKSYKGVVNGLDGVVVNTQRFIPEQKKKLDLLGGVYLLRELNEKGYDLRKIDLNILIKDSVSKMNESLNGEGQYSYNNFKIEFDPGGLMGAISVSSNKVKRVLLEMIGDSKYDGWKKVMLPAPVVPPATIAPVEVADVDTEVEVGDETDFGQILYDIMGRFENDFKGEVEEMRELYSYTDKIKIQVSDIEGVKMYSLRSMPITGNAGEYGLPDRSENQDVVCMKAIKYVLGELDARDRFYEAIDQVFGAQGYNTADENFIGDSNDLLDGAKISYRLGRGVKVEGRFLGQSVERGIACAQTELRDYLMGLKQDGILNLRNLITGQN